MKPVPGKLILNEYVKCCFWHIELAKKKGAMVHGGRRFKNALAARGNAEYWAKRLNIDLAESKSNTVCRQNSDIERNTIQS